MQGDPSFSVTSREAPGDTLLAGFPSLGMAGLTAADYLADQLDLTEAGHVTAEGFPPITPFEGGRPRHHTRLFSKAGVDVTVLVGGLFVPPAAGTPFAEAMLEWAAESVGEVAVLSGVPIPHGPEDHRTYHVATDDYREARLEDVAVPPMGQGFLDGVNAAVLQRGLDSPLRVGVFITPVHAQAPDAEAAIRLVETVEEVYDLGVDAGPLEAFAAEIRQYYEDLAERVGEREELPEDRMYM